MKERYTKEFPLIVKEYIGINYSDYISLLRNEYRGRFNWFAFFFPVLWALYRRVWQPLMAWSLVILIQSCYYWYAFFQASPYYTGLWILLFLLLRVIIAKKGTGQVYRNFNRWYMGNQNKRNRAGIIKTLILALAIKVLFITGSFSFFIIMYRQYRSFTGSPAESGLPEYSFSLVPVNRTLMMLLEESEDITPIQRLSDLPENEPVKLTAAVTYDKTLEYFLTRTPFGIEMKKSHHNSFTFRHELDLASDNRFQVALYTNSNRNPPVSTLYIRDLQTNKENLKSFQKGFEALAVELTDKTVEIYGPRENITLDLNGNILSRRDKKRDNYNFIKTRYIQGLKTALFTDKSNTEALLINKKGEVSFPLKESDIINDFYYDGKDLYTASDNALKKTDIHGNTTLLYRGKHLQDQARHIYKQKDRIILLYAWRNQEGYNISSHVLGTVVMNLQGEILKENRFPVPAGYSAGSDSLRDKEGNRIVYYTNVTSLLPGNENLLTLNSEGNIIKREPSLVEMSYLQIFRKWTKLLPTDLNHIIETLSKIKQKIFQ